MVGNCAWYLHEVSDYDGALDIIDIASKSSGKDRQQSLMYADLCNTAGCCYYEKNHLAKIREAYETTYRIRKSELGPDDVVESPSPLSHRHHSHGLLLIWVFV
jgi:hypothetical protein